MSSINLPVVENGVPKAAVEAAELFVHGYINSGYEDDFLILDSGLTHISLSEEDENGQMLDLEYAYYSISTEDVKACKFSDFNLQSERIRFYQSKLIDGSKTGALSAYTLAGELTPMDFGVVKHEELVTRYKQSVDFSAFEDELFELITYHLSEDVYSFAEVYDFDDVRTFLPAVSKTIDELNNGSFDVTSDDEWWSNVFALSPSELSMFERILKWRVNNLKDGIKAVELEIASDQNYELHNDKVKIAYDGKKLEVLGTVSTPCVIIKLVNGQMKNKLGLGSAAHIADELKKNGSNIVPMDGMFAGGDADRVKLISGVARADAEKLVDATAAKIGVWIADSDNAELIIKKDYFRFDRFSVYPHYLPI